MNVQVASPCVWSCWLPSLTTATTRRSRPSRVNTVLLLQVGPSSSTTLGRAVASSSHYQHTGPIANPPKMRSSQQRSHQNTIRNDQKDHRADPRAIQKTIKEKCCSHPWPNRRAIASQQTAHPRPTTRMLQVNGLHLLHLRAWQGRLPTESAHMHHTRNDFLPSASHALCQFFGPCPIATRSTHRSTKLAHVQHVLSRVPWDMHTLSHVLGIRLIPSWTICLRERSSFFNAGTLASCVWLWCYVWLYWLSGHTDGTSQCELHPLTSFFKKQKNMS